MERVTDLINSFQFEVGKTPFSAPLYPCLGAAAYICMLVLLPLVLKSSKAAEASTGISVDNQTAAKDEGSSSTSNSMKAFEVVHNINLIALSFVMMCGAILSIYDRVMNDGGLWNGFLCSQRHAKDLLAGMTGFWIYIYHLSKYYELIDTLILILKGKDVIFLHAWHHLSMLFVTYGWLYFPLLEGSLWCVFVNSLIHVAMYYYYLMCTLGYGQTIWWKKHLTGGQIVQFWTGMAVCACFLGAQAWSYAANTGFSSSALTVAGVMELLNNSAATPLACAGHTGSCLFSVLVNLSFIILFNRFYKKSYKGKKTEGKNEIKKMQ